MLETPLKKLVTPAFSGLRIGERMLDFPRRLKQAVAVGFDILFALLTVWMAFSLRLELFHRPEGAQWVPYLLAPALMLPVFIYAGLYRAIHRYSGFTMFITVIKATGFYGVLFFAILLLLNLSEVPRSVAILQPILFLLTTGGSRALVRFLYHTGVHPEENPQILPNRLLIYGAGSTGAEIASALQRSSKFDLAGYLDDDPQLQGRTMNGMPVFSPDEVEAIVKREGINNILLAIPSASRMRRNDIVQRLKKLPVCIQMLPGVEEFAAGRVTIADVREVEIEDLLGVGRVDLVILSEADPFLSANIVRGERIFCRDPYAADEYELYILRRAGDLAPLEKERLSLIFDSVR